MKYSIDVTINVTADRAPLVALYNATGGANWTNDTNWLSNEALSEWHRVETDEDGRVTALRLVANELSGGIPAALGNLTNLEDLYLSQNMLSGRLPRTLSALSQLLVLDIRETRLCAPAACYAAEQRSFSEPHGPQGRYWRVWRSRKPPGVKIGMS